MSAQRLARPRPGPKAEPTNIRLSPSLKHQAAEVAVSRYNWSLTHMVSVLLEQECSHKRGIIPQKAR